MITALVPANQAESDSVANVPDNRSLQLTIKVDAPLEENAASRSGTFSPSAAYRIAEINRKLSLSRKSSGFLSPTALSAYRAASLVSPAGSGILQLTKTFPGGSGMLNSVGTPKGASRPERAGSQSVDVKFVGGTRIVSHSFDASKDVESETSPSKASSLLTLAKTDSRRGSSALLRLSILDAKDEKADLSRSDSLLHDKAMDEYVAIPSCGPQLSRLLCARHSSPFEDCDFKTMTAAQLSNSMERAYSNPPKTIKCKYHSPGAGDVVVVSPPRSGQTALLKVLDMMIHSEDTDFSEATFAKRIGWIGSSFSTAAGGTCRLYKSHLPLDHFLSSQNDDPTLDAKIVVILRDPIAIRTSWFRHIKRVFQHFHPNEPFNFTVDDFATLPSGVCSINDPRSSPTSDSYERFLAHVLKFSTRSNLHIVLYEDLISKPLEVLNKLQLFIGTSPSGKCRLSLKMIAKVIDVLDKGSRKSNPVAATPMSRATLCSIQNRWDYEIATKGPWKFQTYNDFRQHFSRREPSGLRTPPRRSTMSFKALATRRKSIMGKHDNESDTGSDDTSKKPKASLTSRLIQFFEKKKDWKGLA